MEQSIALIISEDSVRKRLENYLRLEFNVSTIPLKSIVAAEMVDAGAYIIARSDIGENDWAMVTALGESSKLAVLYGGRPAPPDERRHGVSPCQGALPGCVREWIVQENIFGHESESANLEWDDSGSVPSKTRKIRRIGVWSPGGGVGKTTTVVHLAKLAEQDRLNVGVIETDEDKGGVLRYLGKTPARTGLDSVAKQIWEDPQLFAGEMENIVQTVGRIQVAPMTGTVEGLTCNEETVNTLHQWAASRWAFTIYDLPPRLRDVMTISVLNEVDDVIVVVEPTDVLMDAMEKHLRLCSEINRFKDFPQKYKLLVNKVPENHGLNPQEMADSLGIPLIGVVPAELEHYDRIINKGKFVIPSDSPWRTVYQNLTLGGVKKPVPVPMLKKQKAKSKTQKSFWQRLLG